MNSKPEIRALKILNARFGHFLPSTGVNERRKAKRTHMLMRQPYKYSSSPDQTLPLLCVLCFRLYLFCLVCKVICFFLLVVAFTVANFLCCLSSFVVFCFCSVALLWYFWCDVLSSVCFLSTVCCLVLACFQRACGCYNVLMLCSCCFFICSIHSFLTIIIFYVYSCRLSPNSSFALAVFCLHMVGLIPCHHLLVFVQPNFMCRWFFCVFCFLLLFCTLVCVCVLFVVCSSIRFSCCSGFLVHMLVFGLFHSFGLAWK